MSSSSSSSLPGPHLTSPPQDFCTSSPGLLLKWSKHTRCGRAAIHRVPTHASQGQGCCLTASKHTRGSTQRSWRLTAANPSRQNLIQPAFPFQRGSKHAEKQPSGCRARRRFGCLSLPWPCGRAIALRDRHGAGIALPHAAPWGDGADLQHPRVSARCLYQGQQPQARKRKKKTTNTKPQTQTNTDSERLGKGMAGQLHPPWVVRTLVQPLGTRKRVCS